MTISEDCVNRKDIRTSYEISYTTNCGTPITTCVVDGTECSNGTCQHKLHSNNANSSCQPPVTHISGDCVTVSVTARNIVGKSNSSVSRSISEFSEFEVQLVSYMKFNHENMKGYITSVSHALGSGNGIYYLCMQMKGKKKWHLRIYSRYSKETSKQLHYTK